MTSSPTRSRWYIATALVLDPLYHVISWYNPFSAGRGIDNTSCEFGRTWCNSGSVAKFMRAFKFTGYVVWNIRCVILKFSFILHPWLFFCYSLNQKHELWDIIMIVTWERQHNHGTFTRNYIYLKNLIVLTNASVDFTMRTDLSGYALTTWSAKIWLTMISYTRCPRQSRTVTISIASSHWNRTKI